MAGRTHRWPGHVATVAVCLVLLLLVHIGGCNAALTLRLLQVVHRHGSRSASVSYNKTQICGKVPCGYLNTEGRTMMVNAGKFLRQEYNSDPAKPFFAEEYDVGAVYSRSSDVPRTLQSADGLLWGLFSDPATFFPVIHAIAKNTDWLLRSDMIPYLRAFYLLNDDWKRNECSQKVAETIDFTTLLDISKEVFSEGYCADKGNMCDCATKLYDIGAAMNSEGRLTEFPLLKKNLEKLRSFVEFYFRAEFGYNATDEQHVGMGSQGQILVGQLLANAQLHMQGKDAHKMFHYSTHDMVLSPLAATLGDAGPDGVMPPFAQLYAFELLYDDDADAYAMRVRRGAPGQTPDTKFAFSWDKFQLQCMDSNGAIYKATDNVCPYYDFQRFVDSTKPKDPAGLCYLNDHYKSMFKCPTKPGDPPNSHCRAYRAACPEWACGSGYTLNPTTLQCVCSAASCMELDASKERKSDTTVTPGATAGIAIGTFCVGVCLAACVAVLVFSWWRKWDPSGSFPEHP